MCKERSEDSLPVLNSSEKLVWIIMSWAACLLWGTHLTTFSFTWLKAHSPNTGAISPYWNHEGTLISSGRNDLQTVPVFCITMLWQTFFLSHFRVYFYIAESWRFLHQDLQPAEHQAQHIHRGVTAALCAPPGLYWQWNPLLLLLPLSTRDSDSETDPKPAAGACVEREFTTLDP